MTALTRGKHRRTTWLTRWCDHCAHHHGRVTNRCLEVGCTCPETGR